LLSRGPLFRSPASQLLSPGGDLAGKLDGRLALDGSALCRANSSSVRPYPRREQEINFFYFRFNVVFDSRHASMAEANRRHRLPTESHAAGYDHHTFRLDSPVTDRP
jgi:hypothetical protein